MRGKQKAKVTFVGNLWKLVAGSSQGLNWCILLLYLPTVPAKTTNQLFSTHGQYLDASDSTESDFRAALNEVMPRIYKMGYWREMLVEHTQDASAGYVSLPQDTDSIVAAVIDNNATTTRSIWHDYKLFGTNDQDKTNLSSFIDDGYAPTYRDLVSGSNYFKRVFVF